MKRLMGLILFFLFLVAEGYSQTVREMRFENVRLETVLKALSEVSGTSIIFDPAISQDLQKTVSVAIYKPIHVGEALNIVLKEYSLIAVPVDKRVYRITKAGELSVNVAGLDDKQLRELLDFLKARVSPSAEIVIDRALKTVYIRDEEKNIRKLEPILKDYRKLTEAFVPVEEKVTRIFHLRGIRLDEAESRIKPYTKPDTLITKVYDFSTLVITDTPKQIQLYAEALKPFLTTAPYEKRPVTKIFYLKYISPDEFIKMTEPLRSEAGLVLTGGALIERPVTPPQQPPQVQPTQQQVAPTKAPVPIIKEFNAVMITDYPDVIQTIQDRFGDYISDSPVRVNIETRIVEIRDEALRELGINWNVLLSQSNLPQFWSGGVGSNIGIGVSPPPGTLFNVPPYLTPGLSPTAGGILTFTYQRGMLNALNFRISALERINKARSIAKPSVVAINGQKATIKQGVQVPFLTAAVGPGGTAVPNIQFKDVVLQLDVTPIVSPDGRILMEVEIKRDTLGVQTPQGPAINTKEVRTKIIVENGQTVVLGGVIDNQEYTTDEGIPGMVRVPLLKYLMGQERMQKSDTELLIFITPTMITP